MKTKLGIAVLTASLLTGCAALTGGEDNNPKPVALAPFKAERTVKTVWSTSAGSGSLKDYLKLQPTLDNDTLYTADEKGVVTAITAKTGRHLWQVDLKQPVTSGVTVQDGYLYVGTNTGTVLALEAKTGKVQWQTPVSSVVLSNISVKNDAVVVATGDSKLTVLNAKNGKKIWGYEGSTAPNLTLRGASSPVIAQDRVIAGFSNGSVMAFDLHDGHALWDYTLATAKGWSDIERLVDVATNLVVDDSAVYAVSYQGNVAAIDITSGKPLWQRSMSSDSGMMLAGHALVLSDSEGNVWALESASGETIWKQAALAHRTLSAPAVLGNYVVVGDYAGYVHLLSLEDGHLVGRSIVDSHGILAAPLVADGKAYIAGRSGALAAVTA
jgi:outer membrane protein assembly factor BamB